MENKEKYGFTVYEDTLATKSLTAEEAAADYIKNNVNKPVISYIAGQPAPAGKRMGHAGAIIAGGKGTAAEKIKKLKECGVHVADNLVSIGSKVAEVLG